MFFVCSYEIDLHAFLVSACISCRLEASATARVSRACKSCTHVLMPPYIGALWEVARVNINENYTHSTQFQTPYTHTKINIKKIISIPHIYCSGSILTPFLCAHTFTQLSILKPPFHTKDGRFRFCSRNHAWRQLRFLARRWARSIMCL